VPHTHDPVTNQKPFYEQLQNGPLCNYWTFNNNDKETFYYKRVIIEALRGIDYIATLPCWDEKNLGVLGSSQGGWLTIVCAALDKRVTCYAPVHPALCDLTASLKNIPCGWPHYFYNNTQTPDPKVLNTLAYYDGINFTQRITQPGWYSFGYNDDVVPPTTCWATYNNVKAPKEIHIYPKTKHFWNQEQYDQWIQWLDMKLNITHLK
ncbi:MAG: acetylxylan esterase, partial [Bacteroidaceae bacterium]|nr:acetylxylan esterase [Bacteroidaceae bacterium]